MNTKDKTIYAKIMKLNLVNNDFIEISKKGTILE